MKLHVIVLAWFLPVLAWGVSLKTLNDNYRNYYYNAFKVQWKFEEFQVDSQVYDIARAMYHLHAPTFIPNEAKYTPNFYSWVTGRITSTSYYDKCDGAVARTGTGGNLSICGPYMNETESRQASTLVHEAAHASSSDPGHVNCAHGVYTYQTQGCDAVLYDGFDGSGYNYDFMYWKWILNGSNYNELDRAEIGSNMSTYVMNRFNSVTNEQVKTWSK